MRITSDSKKKIVTSCNKFCRGGFGQKIRGPGERSKNEPPYSANQERKKVIHTIRSIVDRDPGGTEVFAVNLDRSLQ